MRTVEGWMARGWGRTLIAALRSLLRIVAGVVLGLAILLLLFQHQMVYHPRPYTDAAEQRMQNVITLRYTTSQGAQDSFYLAPAQPPLRHLWVLFSGNGSLALDWLGMLTPPPDARDGYLMIDYPGYGDCHGWASPEAIEESAEAALAALASSLNEKPDHLGNLNLLCHSLGCATGLNFAVHHPVDRVILLAPFTSMRDMAARTVHWPLCLLLLHNYDNRARLAELAARAHPPAVTIFHGEDDPVIPVAMGRALAAEQPRMITFHALPGADHNSVLQYSREAVVGLMR